MLLKLHNEDEQGPPECWAAVIVALGWYWFRWLWQTSWSFPFLSHLLNQFLNQCLFLLVIAADGFVMEFAVDQWTMWRTSHLLHHFLFFLGVAADHFSWRHIPYLLVNEENQFFHTIMRLGNPAPSSWKYSPFNASSSVPKEEGNGHHVGALFPLFFWIILNLLMLLWQTWVWDFHGLGFFLVFGLGWWLEATSFIFLLP